MFNICYIPCLVLYWVGDEDDTVADAALAFATTLFALNLIANPTIYFLLNKHAKDELCSRIKCLPNKGDCHIPGISIVMRTHTDTQTDGSTHRDAQQTSATPTTHPSQSRQDSDNRPQKRASIFRRLRSNSYPNHVTRSDQARSPAKRHSVTSELSTVAHIPPPDQQDSLLYAQAR